MCVTGASFNLVHSRSTEFRDLVVLHTMASMPFGMHAVQKVRANMSLSANAATTGNKRQKDNNINYKFNNDQYVDPSPSKYCDKMMNSIWGLYNRYSVHNFKSNTSSGQAQTTTLQQPATKESQDWLQNPIKCPLEGMKLNFNSKNFHQ